MKTSLSIFAAIFAATIASAEDAPTALVNDAGTLQRQLDVIEAKLAGTEVRAHDRMAAEHSTGGLQVAAFGPTVRGDRSLNTSMEALATRIAILADSDDAVIPPGMNDRSLTAYVVALNVN